jgi:hypothetical protein
MVNLFGMKRIAALNSRHIEGKAIDMTIAWKGVLNIRDAKGNAVPIKSTPRDGGNIELHCVGATYQVFQLVSDPPHWSSDRK